MGKYRDHRQPRSRDDESHQGFEESEPRYFQRNDSARTRTNAAETASSLADDAELLWFNAGKGFGFVRMSTGSDAFLHGSKLQAAGHSDLPVGAVLKVRIEAGQKGPQVAEILAVVLPDNLIAAIPTSSAPELSIQPAAEELERAGVVTRYDGVKGFGFIKLKDGDVFVHATALTRNGLSSLQAGQNVLVNCAEGRKGLEVRSIRLL